MADLHDTRLASSPFIVLFLIVFVITIPRSLSLSLSLFLALGHTLACYASGIRDTALPFLFTTPTFRDFLPHNALFDRLSRYPNPAAKA